MDKYNYEPKPYRYRMKVWQPTPEEKAKLDGWHKEIWERARRRLRERDGR